MLTWIRLWPVFIVPIFFINMLGFLPTVFEMGRYWGGGPVRQWMLNTFLLPLLSYSHAEQIVYWFNHEATIFQECLMYGVIILNLDIFSLPVIYGIGNGVMKLLNWSTVKELNLKRKAAR